MQLFCQQKNGREHVEKAMVKAEPGIGVVLKDLDGVFPEVFTVN